MSAPINLRVPKSMAPEHVAWAFRYGVAWAKYTVHNDASVIRRHGLAFTIAPRNVHLLADRVRREATRRMQARAEVEIGGLNGR